LIQQTVLSSVAEIVQRDPAQSTEFGTLLAHWDSGASANAEDGALNFGRVAPLGALAVDRLKRSAFVGGVAGLQLNVSAKGVKSWRLFYRLPGDTRRRAMTLGRFPELGLADARIDARAALKRAGRGEDPKAKRAEQARTNLLLVNEALDDYLVYCARENSKATVQDKTRAFRKHLRPRLGKRPLVQVARSEWLSVVDAAALTKSMRRSLYMYIRHFLVWALERGHIENHPLWGIRPPKRGLSRDRVLCDAEIKHLWSVEGETAELARLALLTAQRQGSLARMQWPHVDLDAQTWSIPAEDMKAGKPHVVPLTQSVLAILRARHAKRLKGPYVFGVRSEGFSPYDGFSNGMEGLRMRLAGEESQQGKRLTAAFKAKRRERLQRASSTGWRFHDLRRTAVTLAQRGGANVDAIKALTQHKTAGVIGIYARHAFHHEKEEVAQLIEAQLLAILAKGKQAETGAPQPIAFGNNGRPLETRPPQTQGSGACHGRTRRYAP
jgi:integrase